MNVAEPALRTARTVFVTAPFRAAAAMRGARVFHPRGLVVAGKIEFESSWWPLPRGTPLPVVARFSGGIGTPSRMPDVLGLAQV
ncbi:MAG: hypothetical protein WAW17_07315 [Rhodococcus sp. (in: high G+C Gram-positive bacteria)]|uniref:hypothetical protein n=1 Tax=Rhodococcus sp. TaxID=1831 RepID=UPI003BAEB8BE